MLYAKYDTFFREQKSIFLWNRTANTELQDCGLALPHHLLSLLNHEHVACRQRYHRRRGNKNNGVIFDGFNRFLLFSSESIITHGSLCGKTEVNIKYLNKLILIATIVSDWIKLSIYNQNQVFSSILRPGLTFIASMRT